MSLVSEQPPHPCISERDTSRAHWQRTVGVVVMREMAENYFGCEPQEITGRDLVVCDAWAEAIDEELGDWAERTEPTLAARAYAISDYFLSFPKTGYTEEYNDELEEQFEEHTHFQNSSAAFEEGLRAQSKFPLNLAFWVSSAACEKGVEGFSIDTLSDIARIFRRSDFQTLVDISAFTRNGLWQNFSTQIQPDFRYTTAHTDMWSKVEVRELEVEFENGNVTFAEFFKKFLREELARINRAGSSSRKNTVANRTSSGCPARWNRPHFTAEPEDQRNLKLLVDHYRKTAEELTKPDEPVIIKTMNFMADIFDRTDKAYRELK